LPTVIKLFTGPPAVGRLFLFSTPGFSPPLALRGFVKQAETSLEVELGDSGRGGNDTDRLPRRNPFDLIAGVDPILFGNRLGERHLEFAGNFGHRPYYSKDLILVKRRGSEDESE
jgi:hypothetical protein